MHPINQHHTLHPTITKLLINTFELTHSYYFSPLICPTQLQQYYTIHNRDIIFNSPGHAKSSKWTCRGLAHPTDHNTTMEAIHWAHMVAKETDKNITNLIINQKDWSSQQIKFMEYIDVHTIATISP